MMVPSVLCQDSEGARSCARETKGGAIRSLQGHLKDSRMEIHSLDDRPRRCIEFLHRSVFCAVDGWGKEIR